MNLLSLAWTNAKFYWRTNVGVAAGVALATAVLLGAMAVGDSVRSTLQSLADSRLGQVQYVLATHDRWLPADLAERVELQSGGAVTPAIHLRGAATTPDETARANQVQLLGVRPEFFSLRSASAKPLPFHNSDESVFLNRTLAQQLNVTVGDEVLFLLPKPSLLPREAPLVSKRDSITVISRTVTAIVGDEQFGNISLQANQVTPMTAFVSLDSLAAELKQPGRVNLLLAGRCEKSCDQLNAALRRVWQFGDTDWQLRKLSKASQWELTSRQIFFPDVLAGRALDGLAGSPADKRVGVLSYLVNEFCLGDRAAPYSLIAAVEPNKTTYPGNLIQGLSDDEIALHSWLADDLHAKVGDRVTLKFYVLDGLKLKEQVATFRVGRVLPKEQFWRDPSLTPSLPGVSDKASCRQWKAGIPMDLAKLRDKDEAFWQECRATPKAFISLRAGRRLWANRYGDLTAVRFSASPAATADSLSTVMLREFKPSEFGLRFFDQQARNQQAAGEAMDFGGLFFGLSFFLIVSAILLTALLFAFGVNERREAVGLLRAVGWRTQRIRRLLLLEGLLVAPIGIAVGLQGGLGFTAGCVWALSSIWRGAVAGFPIQFSVSFASFVLAAALSLLAAGGVMALALRRLGKSPVRALLAGSLPSHTTPIISNAVQWRQLTVAIPGLVFIVLAAMTYWGQDTRSGLEQAGWFFATGSVAMGVCIWAIARRYRTASFYPPADWLPRELMQANLRRRLGRNVTSMALLAIGIFLTVAIQLFHLTPPENPHDRNCGTGGFTLYAESALPIWDDLTTCAGRQKFGLTEMAWKKATVIPLRIHDGDDASCLNLNRPQQPRIIGVSPEAMRQFEAFGQSGENVWAAMKSAAKNGDTIHAVADEPTMTWALQRAAGETLTIQTPDSGLARLKFLPPLPSSILQGAVLIREADFIRLFPDQSGYRAFLIGDPYGRQLVQKSQLTEAGSDYGLEVTLSTQRLAAFQEVQNTYLSIFSILGAIGLLLGAAGFAIVAARNIQERRRELALLQALGWTRGRIRYLIVGEHLQLMAAAMLCAYFGIIISVGPSLQYERIPLAPILWMLPLILVIVCGLFVWWMTHLATRGSFLQALREE